MKKKFVFIVPFLLIIVAISAFKVKDYYGKAGYTGSPGESTCKACHLPGAPLGTISITSSPAFVANKYTPNQTYTIYVTCKHPTLSLFGFDCEILNGTSSGAVNSGYMHIAGTATSIITSYYGIKNAVHVPLPSLGGPGPYTRAFYFVWDAPAYGTAAIYASGIAVNNNDLTSGDATVSTSLVLSSITANGIKDSEENPVSLSVYPNPSFENISIQYDLIADGEVKASLFNLQGKEIVTLYSEQQSKGIQNKKILYPDDLVAGAYFIKISSNGKDIATKMIIKN